MLDANRNHPKSRMFVYLSKKVRSPSKPVAGVAGREPVCNGLRDRCTARLDVAGSSVSGELAEMFRTQLFRRAFFNNRREF